LGRIIFFFLLFFILSPMVVAMRELFPADSGDVRHSLTDNLKTHALGHFSQTATSPSDAEYSEIRLKRDKAAEDVLAISPGKTYFLCDLNHRIQFRKKVEGYTYAKVQSMRETARKHGEAAAQRMELIWNDARARNAEHAIIEAFSERHLDLDDFGKISRIEARRLAARAKDKPARCNDNPS
jgi:YHS domain-containing protein